MRNDKHLALKMRQRGSSYKQIRQELGVPISTLSDWFAKLEWSQELRKELIKKTGKIVSKFHRERWEKWRQQFRDKAQEEFLNLYQDSLFIVGLMLYWGEGDSSKNNSMVRLVNTDPRMITLFCSFLRQVIKVKEEKIKASLVLYPDLSDQLCKEYWSKITGIPLNRFHKTQVIKGKHPTKRTSYGMCTICISSRGLKEQIYTWINLLYKKHVNDYQ